eukprot:jgi/Bigna1/72563/fgenesh1_pg.20_\
MFGEVDDDVTINPDSPKSIADDNNSRLELVDLGDDNSVFQDDGQDKIAHENVAPPKSRRAIQNSLENVQSYPKVVSVVQKVKATKSKEKNDEKKKFEPQSSVAQQKVSSGQEIGTNLNLKVKRMSSNFVSPRALSTNESTKANESSRKPLLRNKVPLKKQKSSKLMPPPAPGRNMDAVTLSRLHSQQDILSSDSGLQRLPFKYKTPDYEYDHEVILQYASGKMNEIEGAIVQFPKLLKQKTESITALALKNLRENMLNAFQNEMQNQLIDMETSFFKYATQQGALIAALELVSFELCTCVLARSLVCVDGTTQGVGLIEGKQDNGCDVIHCQAFLTCQPVTTHVQSCHTNARQVVQTFKLGSTQGAPHTTLWHSHVNTQSSAAGVDDKKPHEHEPRGRKAQTRSSASMKIIARACQHPDGACRVTQPRRVSQSTDKIQNHMGDRHVGVAEPQQQSLQGLVSTLLVVSNTTSQHPMSKEAKDNELRLGESSVNCWCSWNVSSVRNAVPRGQVANSGPTFFDFTSPRTKLKFLMAPTIASHRDVNGSNCNQIVETRCNCCNQACEFCGRQLTLLLLPILQPVKASFSTGMPWARGDVQHVWCICLGTCSRSKLLILIESSLSCAVHISAFCFGHHGESCKETIQEVRKVCSGVKTAQDESVQQPIHRWLGRHVCLSHRQTGMWFRDWRKSHPRDSKTPAHQRIARQQGATREGHSSLNKNKNNETMMKNYSSVKIQWKTFQESKLWRKMTSEKEFHFERNSETNHENG